MSESTRHRSAAEDEGFTLVELVVTIALTAVVFTFLALLLGGTLRTVAVQKARTQGNEVATQGIEDLQRLDYDKLAVCQAPGGSAPAGLSDPVLVTNACSGSTDLFNPCNDITGIVPAETYDCVRRSTTYRVRRFVAWGDPNRTEKRLAVFVRWTDQAGTHEVSQQSSLRIPTRANIVGLPSPQVVFPAGGPLAPSPNVLVDASGALAQTLTMTAHVANPSPSGAGLDTMVASLKVVEGGATVEKTIALPWTNDSDSTVDIYQAIIPAGGLTVPKGSQFVTFSVIRKDDAKVNSRVATPALRFCEATCPADLPVVTGTVTDLAGDPSTIRVDNNGSLVSNPFRFTATTTNVRSDQAVSVVLQTLTGAVTVSLSPTTAFACDVSTCAGTWQADVTPAAGLLFAAGSQSVFFSASQTIGPDVFETGHTAAASVSITMSTTTT